MASALKALSLEWIGPGLLLAFVAIGGRRGLRSIWNEYRVACVTGTLLLLAGIAVYLPMNLISGRIPCPPFLGPRLLDCRVS